MNLKKFEEMYPAKIPQLFSCLTGEPYSNLTKSEGLAVLISRVEGKSRVIGN